MLRASTIFLVVIVVCTGALGHVSPEVARKIHEQATPSLVAVQYVFVNELGRREVIGPGVVVGEDGIVMMPLDVLDMRKPDDQLQEFKIIVPHENRDDEELDAILMGRDERTKLAFVKSKEKQRWQAIRFEDIPVKVGDVVVSVGIMPRAGGYRSYFAQATVAAHLRGEVPHVMVSGGGLSGVGSVVFNTDGKAVGFVNSQWGQTPFLNDERYALSAIVSPPSFLVPSRDFLLGLGDMPVAGQEPKLPWVGIPQLNGLKKDVAEFYGLKNQPAAEIGDVVPGSPADKAGLKPKYIIIKLNGQPLERGDDPDEVPAILRRKLLRMKVAEELTLSVLPEKDAPLKDFTLRTEEQPKREHQARRYYAEDLGFVVREIVFTDTYRRRLPADQKGVVVAVIRPQSSAENGKLQSGDLITTMNGQGVTDPDQFKKPYESLRKEKPREAIVLVVLRAGKEETIRVEPPQ